MMPKLGDKYQDVELEVISNLITEIPNHDHFELHLLVASRS